MMTVAEAIHWRPTALDLAQFLDAFWPELAATALGVALGLPAAWWVQRWFQREAEREQRLHEAEVVRECCRLLAASVRRNLRYAEALQATLSAGRVPVAAGLESATFEMVRDDVARLVQDAELRVFVARWFERIGQVERLVDHGVIADAAPRRVVQTTGMRTLDLTEGLRNGISDTALRLVEALIADAPELEARLERVAADSQSSERPRSEL